MSNYKPLFEKIENNITNEKTLTTSVQDPNWLMAIPKLTKSQIEGFKTSCQIFDHEFAMHREIEQSIAKDLMKPNGGLIGHDLKVIILSSSINADVNLYFYQNMPLKSVTLYRIGRINTDTPQALETYIFSLCYITSIIAKGDYLSITFRYSGVERKTPELKKDGSAAGVHSAHHDFIKVKSDQGTPEKKETKKKKKKKEKKSKKKSKK